jgi:hypothetical protein
LYYSKNFFVQLKNYLISGLEGEPYTGDINQYSQKKRLEVIIVNNQLFRHPILRVNSTTYDMRRMQDTIKPAVHPFVMYLSPYENSPFPYEFAAVIGIFHTFIIDNRPTARSSSRKLVQLLWIRRMELDLKHKSGWKAQRLHRVRFIPTSTGDAFGFLDPNDIIRGVHLIPAFASGQTTELLEPALSIQYEENKKDWVEYYVNQ